MKTLQGSLSTLKYLLLPSVSSLTGSYLSVEGPSLSPRVSVEVGGCSVLGDPPPHMGSELCCAEPPPAYLMVLEELSCSAWGAVPASPYGMLGIKRFLLHPQQFAAAVVKYLGVMPCAFISLTTSLDSQWCRISKAPCQTAQKQNPDSVPACSLRDTNHSFVFMMNCLSALPAVVISCSERRRCFIDQV